MEYLGLEEPGSPWSQRSRGLAEGLLEYEASLNRFGIPKRDALDDDSDGWYEIDDTTIDYSEAALQRWEKDNPNAEPGVIPRVVDTRLEKAPPRRAPARPNPEEEASGRSTLVERGLDN